MKIAHADKIFFPKVGRAPAYTKGDLGEYYERVASYILPAIAGHPLVLRRFPDGIKGQAFYQHRAPEDVPDDVEVADVEAGGNIIPHLIGGKLATTLYAVQLGAISMDPWHSRVGSVDTPDYTIIDLDPGDKATFTIVTRVARAVKVVLDELGLHAVPKTSGMSGIHIVLPLKKGTHEDAARLAAQIVAQTVAERNPRIATVTREVHERGAGQVYVDYLQNIRGKTVSSVYSLRPHPLAQVSAPLHWDEVTAKLKPSTFTIATMAKRLEKVGDLWAEGMRTPNDLRALVAGHGDTG